MPDILVTETYTKAKTYYEQKKFERAFPLFMQLAELNNTDAQFYLYRMYSSGESVENDSEQANLWLRKAAEQGHAEAQYRLGQDCFDPSYSIFHDPELDQAKHWFLKAAVQGHMLAQYWTGLLHSSRFSSRDNELALKWYLKAAEQGFSGAQYGLGKMYLDGLNVESKYLYEHGIPTDFAKSSFWLRKAAEQGHAEAQCCLGFLFRYGKGVKKSHGEAAYWYEKSANQGNSDAAIALSKRKLWWLK